MATRSPDITSRWLVYAFTVVLGLAFALILFSIAWNSAIESRKKATLYDLTALRQTIAHNILDSNNVVNNLVAFINTRSEFNSDEFIKYSHKLLEIYPYIDNVVYFSNSAGSTLKNGDNGDKSFLIQYEVARDSNIFDAGHDVNADEQLVNVFDNLFISHNSGIISTVYFINGSAKYGVYGLIREGQDSDENTKGIVSIYTNPERFFGQFSLPDDMSLTLYSEYASIGRQLLYKKETGQSEKKGWIISPVTETNQIQLPYSSVKLEINKNIYWSDIEKGLIYIALLIGMGVTLLLVALTRSREMQARELRERNIVIENTVKEQTRELALARDQAVEASVMKSDFLASMSHEIRTPLNAIIGMSELLSETKLSEDQEKYISVFKRAGDTLLNLVNDILDLSKIEAHQLILENISFSLLDVVEESVEIYALKAAEKGIDLHSHIGPGIEINRIGDPGRLKQILLNLISNALKFTDQGEIKVNADICKDTNDERILFSVQDTGIGIPAEKLDAIFESFTQADSSTTRKYGGTGLGLTISKSLVELMGGQIQVTSEPGAGSNFHFSIKLPVDRNKTSSATISYSEISGKNILVIAVNETLQKIICENLESRHGKIICVGSANQGLSAFKKTQFDLVIIDYNLHGSDGFHLVSNLKTINPATFFIMMLSPNDLNERMSKIREFGIDACLVKPIKRNELLEAVHNCFIDKTKKTSTVNKISDNYNLGIGKRLLLVDDNPDNRMLIRTYLKKTSIEIDEAENGQIAFDMYKKGKYDLVLMDIQMPVMDGHAATRAIREFEKQDGSRITPVIALTAHASKEEIEKCRMAGCNDHMAKPVKKSALMNTLNNILMK